MESLTKGISTSHSFTPYRGEGESKFLMEETLIIYERENVEIAILEAIKENKVAIALYKKYGYVIANQLLFLSGENKASRKYNRHSHPFV